MKDENVWNLIREGAPLPQTPVWFASTTVSRLRTESRQSPGWGRFHRWLLSGAYLSLLLVGVALWQVHAYRLHEERVTFAALDALASDDQSRDQDSTWLTYY